MTALAVCFAAGSSLQAAVTFDLGNGEISASTVGLNDANAFATGAFTTAAVGGSAGISFDFTISTTNGGLAPQDTALGVAGGTAGSGLDNSNGAGPQETMTFTISNFSGLGAGETLAIIGVGISFGNNGGEVYTINGGPDTAFVGGTPQAIDTPDGVSVTIGAGSTGDTRFAIDTFTVEVVSAVPEPSGVSLLGLAAMGLLGRRRRTA